VKVALFDSGVAGLVTAHLLAQDREPSKRAADGSALGALPALTVLS